VRRRLQLLSAPRRDLQAAHRVTKPPPEADWETPEVGEAIRCILDNFEGAVLPKAEARRRFLRLVELAETRPRVLVAAYSAILHGALDLGGVLPAPATDIRAIRVELEKAAYRGIAGMDG
jgi:hypothetical protein